jgi:cell volume regulation protein A
LGSIVASTDAAAVFFLLRAGGMRLSSRVGHVLEIESGTNDPVAVFMTIVFTQLLLSGNAAAEWSVIGFLAEQAAIGTCLGIAGGLVAVALLNRIDMPGGLHPLFVVASALIVYSSTSLAGGSGLLAVYLAGLVMGNRPVRAYPSIVGFHDAATWLCQIVMFLVLGLLVTPTTLQNFALPGLGIALFLIFVARPVAVWLCLSPFGFNIREKTFISWVGLRGAVSIFLAAIPTLADVPNADVFFNVAFFVVLVSLLLQGWTVTDVAHRLGMALRQSTPSVSRVEVDIPGQLEQELVGYPVSQDSLVLLMSRLPAWARLVMVVRDDKVIDGVNAGSLKSGDYAYFLVRPERIARLDGIMHQSPDVARRSEPLDGELPFNGDARLADINGLYDIGIPSHAAPYTVSEYFTAHFKDHPHLGSRLAVGSGVLVVRAVKDGVVTRAGLQLEELIDSLVAAAAPPSFVLPDWRKSVQAIRKNLTRWWRKNEKK